MCCITQHLDIFFPPSCQISSTHETSPPSPQPILNYRSTGTETAKAPSGQIRVDDKFAGFLAASHLLIYCSPLHPVTLSPSSLPTPTTRRTPRCTSSPGGDPPPLSLAGFRVGREFVHLLIAQIKWATVSDFPRLLRTKVAHDKWASCSWQMSELLGFFWAFAISLTKKSDLPNFFKT